MVKFQDQATKHFLQLIDKRRLSMKFLLIIIFTFSLLHSSEEFQEHRSKDINIHDISTTGDNSPINLNIVKRDTYKIEQTLVNIKVEINKQNYDKEATQKKFQNIDTILTKYKDQNLKQIDKLRQNISNLHQEFTRLSTLEDNTVKLKKNFQNFQKNIDININYIQNNITNIKLQLNTNKANISTLMEAFKQGNLSTLSFYTPYIQTININDTWYKGLGLEYERLYNSSALKDFSLTINLSMIGAEEKNQYISEDKQFFLFDLGIKKPIYAIDKSYGIYTKGSLGYLWNDEQSTYTKLGIGIEKYNKKHKINFEIHYFGVFEKESTAIINHHLGNDEVIQSKNFEHGIALIFGLSFNSF